MFSFGHRGGGDHDDLWKPKLPALSRGGGPPPDARKTLGAMMKGFQKDGKITPQEKEHLNDAREGASGMADDLDDLFSNDKEQDENDVGKLFGGRF